jgi:hypothetical protein
MKHWLRLHDTRCLIRTRTSYLFLFYRTEKQLTVEFLDTKLHTMACLFDAHQSMAFTNSEFYFWNLWIYFWTFIRTPWIGDQPVARPLSTQDSATQKTWTYIHALSEIRTHDPSVRADEDCTCLRQRGHWDRHVWLIKTKIPCLTRHLQDFSSLTFLWNIGSMYHIPWHRAENLTDTQSLRFHPPLQSNVDVINYTNYREITS